MGCAAPLLPLAAVEVLTAAAGACELCPVAFAGRFTTKTFNAGKAKKWTYRMRTCRGDRSGRINLASLPSSQRRVVAVFSFLNIQNTYLAA